MQDEEKSLVDALVSAAGSMPAPVETAFIKALSRFLGGLTAIPASWLRRPAQANEDITNARSAVSAIIAKEVAVNALKDPIVMQAAAEVYLPDAIRKAENRVRVAQLATERINDSADASDNPNAPNEDWMNTFARFAEDASSERLQDLFARILSGEVQRPGSFSSSTLRVVSELDRQIAEDFTLMWARSVGPSIDHTEEFAVGPWYSRWQRLVEAGLMASEVSAQYLPDYQPVFGEFAAWAPMSYGDATVVVYFLKDVNAVWRHIPFTRSGRELGTILAPPNFHENMRTAGRRLGQRFNMRVDLMRNGAIERLS